MTVSGFIILSAITYYGIGFIKTLFGSSAPIIAIVLLAAYLFLLWVGSRQPELEIDDPNSPCSNCPKPAPRYVRACTTCCRWWCWCGA